MSARLSDLDELRVFVQIVESGSLTAAGRALSMPANTVGRRLASLEGRVGKSLLARTTRSQSLTDAGHTLLARAARILAEVDEAEQALSGEDGVLSGVVRLSVPSVVSRDLIRPVAHLMEAHPGLRLKVVVNDRMVNPVSEGLDVVVMGGAPADSSLIGTKLGVVQPVLAAATAYLDRAGRPQTPDDLRSHRTLRFATHPPQTSFVLVDAGGAQHEVPVAGRFEAGDGRTLMDGIAAGLGVGMTSHRVLRSLPGVERVLPGYTLRSFPVFAFVPPASQRIPRVRAVVDVLREAMLTD